MDGHDGADAIERAWRDGLKPDPLLTVSEWADRYRVLSQRASSEPGRWRTERTPTAPLQRGDKPGRHGSPPCLRWETFSWVLNREAPAGQHAGQGARAGVALEAHA